MVPAGANPHVYEPYPDQINKLRRSVAYISNGFLGFEETWLPRFYEINKSMMRISLGDRIEPIASEHEHEGHHHVEGADPHYWVSPAAAKIFVSDVLDLLVRLNPGSKDLYLSNYSELVKKITENEVLADSLFSGMKNRAFMIYHPNLAYLARDYGLREIPVEYEGKEPPPSRLKELIDFARSESIKTIFVQKEYDLKNSKAIADEIGADVVVIDPLSEEWDKSTGDIIKALHYSFIKSKKQE
jgi:zinc transport system substrate-binding protein